MLRKTTKFALAVMAGVAILFGGFVLGSSTAGERAGVGASVARGVSSGSSPNMDLFWEVWELINEDYLDSGEVSDEEKVRGAAMGLVDSLGDPYSEYFPPEDAESFREDVTGNFGGIGAQLGMRDDAITIISPLKGSPAEEAGLRPGDKILFVDETPAGPLDVDEAVNIIRGPVGEPVKLVILREGWEEPRDFTIVRDRISLPTLDWEVQDDGVIYIQLYQFNANAHRLFFEAVRSAALRGGKAVVLDLRGNPGGYLDTAVNLAGWFLPRGEVVVTQEGREGVEEVMRANGNMALARVPVVVLIDEGSASASEILAGALRDHRDIPLVGTESFGKGTVQELQNLSDGSLVKLTVAHWVLPSGQVLGRDGGLKPDHEVELTEEDIEAGRDPQLDKALEVVREELGERS